MSAQNGNPLNSSSTKRRKGSKQQKHSPKPPKLLDGKASSFHHSINSFPNSNIPSDHFSYNYFPMNYSHHHTTEPTSLPIYPVMYQNHLYGTSGMPNGYTSASVKPPGPFSNNYMVNSDNSATEYTSLPVGSRDSDHLDPENSVDKRRFSDPGFALEDEESDSHESNFGPEEQRLIHRLSRQVDALKEANRRLNRDVVDLRMELNSLKQQQSLRHYEREYEPGMLSEVIREIRDAARVREDALLAKVKHMIEEKQFSMSQMNMANSKSLYADRVAKLEEQMKNIHLNISPQRNRLTMESSTALSASTSGLADDGEVHHKQPPNLARQVIELEREALLLRKELQEARAKKEESDQQFIHYF